MVYGLICKKTVHIYSLIWLCANRDLKVLSACKCDKNDEMDKRKTLRKWGFSWQNFGTFTTSTNKRCVVQRSKKALPVALYTSPAWPLFRKGGKWPSRSSFPRFVFFRPTHGPPFIYLFIIYLAFLFFFVCNLPIFLPSASWKGSHLTFPLSLLLPQLFENAALKIQVLWVPFLFVTLPKHLCASWSSCTDVPPALRRRTLPFCALCNTV